MSSFPSTSPTSQQSHFNAIPRVPWECITKAIEWIDNRQDLFNLLTVSKNVFHIAARCLYRDPFKGHTCDYDDNVRRIVLFLLSLSPVNGTDIDIIRQSNGLPPSGTPLDPKPMLDYLSLVKVVRWRHRRFEDEDQLYKALRYQNTDMYKQLTWAFVGHRLNEVEELELDVEDQERYLNNASKMTCLRKIWIHIGEDLNYMAMYGFAEAMIKAIQLHHGVDQLSECHFIPNPLLKGPRKLRSLSDIDDYEFLDIDPSRIQKILSLLPVPRRYLTLPRPGGSTAALNHPFDPHMATIQDIWFTSLRNSDISWKTILKVYPGHSHAQIIQRFRGMTSLSIHSEMLNDNYENLLAWAACEAEHYYHRPGGHHLTSLVPLEKLEIMYNSTESDSTTKLKILEDGLLGFSGTLKLLRVIYHPFNDRMLDHLFAFTIPRPVYNLKSLTLRNLTNDRSSWQQVPNIEEMYVQLDFPLSIFGTDTSNEPQDDQNTNVTLPLAVSVDTLTITPKVVTEQQQQRQLPEFWFHCPKLMTLRLSDRAINLLDPNCLHLSPNLQSLSLISTSVSFRERMVSDGIDSRKAWEALKVLHPSRWTWDWSFPVLRHLGLYGDFHEFKFSLAILRSCPTLEWMDLHHDDAQNRFPLRAKGILDDSTNKSNNKKLQFTHCNLIGIKFHGRWEYAADELDCLLKVLLGLKNLELYGVYGFGDRELVEITKTHPSLAHVVTDMKLTTEPPGVICLSEIDSDNHEAKKSIYRARYGEVINKVSEEQSCKYSFGRSNGYDLYLS